MGHGKQFALFVGAHMKYPGAILLWLVTMLVLAALEVAYAVRLILQVVESNDHRFITIGQIVCQFLLVREWLKINWKKFKRISMEDVSILIPFLSCALISRNHVSDNRQITFFSVGPLLLDGGLLCVARGEGGGEAPEGGLAAAEVVPLRQRPSRPRPHREEEDSHVLRGG